MKTAPNIDLSRLKIESVRVDFTIDRDLPWLGRFTVRVRVPNRETGESIEVRLGSSYPLECSDEDLAQLVHATVAEALVHELDECFFVNGVRVYDPHSTSGSQ